MKRLVVIAALLMSSIFADANVCGRFTEPIKSILKQSLEIQFDFKKITPLSSWETSHCFYYDPRGVRCDITYDSKPYFFFFNEKFSKTDVDSQPLKPTSCSG